MLRKSDKGKDYPAEPKGDLVLDKMKTINENCEIHISLPQCVELSTAYSELIMVAET